MAIIWKKAGENLVRHPSGTFYVRAKVNGKAIRKSLETDELRIAKLKRDVLIDSLRKGAVKKDVGYKTRKLGDILRTVAKQIYSQPHLRPNSVEYYKEVMQSLERSLPVTLLARLLTPQKASAWWRSVADSHSAQKANNMLSMARKVGDELVAKGLRADNPFEGLRRVSITQRELRMPSKDEVDAIIGEIRSQGKAQSEQAANFVGLLAFAGCRVSQARALTWKDISNDWIEFQGDIEGTKKAKRRRLPINGPLREVLARIHRDPKLPDMPLFSMKTPRAAFQSACERLGMQRLRIHDLRHFFASWAVESGVDVPTVSRWLGHKDGGALALRVYGHLRDDHSQEAAKRLG